MPHFVCEQCRHSLTPPLRKVELPDQVASPEPPPTVDGLVDRSRPARMLPGTYALLIDPNEHVSEPRGCVVHPEDVPGARQNPDRSTWAGCCGLDGMLGMNLVCGGCGATVATEQSACFTQYQVVLDFAATMKSFREDDEQV